MNSADFNPWLLRSTGGSRAKRLYCFSYAGGNAAAYLPWQERLEPNVEVCAIQLPGRGARWNESPYSDMRQLLDALCEMLGTECLRDQRPFAFFGHSLGALLAFETARMCVRVGIPVPQRLLLSGCSAPQFRKPPKNLHKMPGDELIAALAKYNGSPAEVLAHRPLMELLLPALRADFSLAENYVYEAGAPLDIPITVLTGKRDPHVQLDKIAQWQLETTASCHVRYFEGDHFFINSERDAVLRCISEELGVTTNYFDRAISKNESSYFSPDVKAVTPSSGYVRKREVI